MHWLEDISFNEEFKEPSLIQKWLKRIFLKKEGFLNGTKRITAFRFK